MIRRIPILATLVVFAAVAIMLRLGLWQLERRAEKEMLIAQFEAAMQDRGAVFDLDQDKLQPPAYVPPFYGQAKVTCVSGTGDAMRAGRNAAGEPGWAHVVSCGYRPQAGALARRNVIVGWSREPRPVKWTGGGVTGTIVPESTKDTDLWHIVADPPLAGLAANAKPDPRDIPNNHLSYAVQWFLFAAVALVIYGLALRKRLKG